MEDDGRLDETFWFLDPSARPWLDGVNQNHGWPHGVNGVNAENVHIYFNESFFCPIDSSNKQFQIETGSPNATRELIETYFDRKRFEANLAMRSGTEFVIIDGPEKSFENMNPIWVVRRQVRAKDRMGGEDDVTVTGHFYVVGDLIFQSASMFDLLSMRITSLQHQLSTFYKAAASLPFYSIERGYYYFPSIKPRTVGSLESARSSRASSEIPDAASQTSTRVSKDTTERDDDRAIAESFSKTLIYGAEYMDENPLIGEPGAFKFSTTNRNVRDKHAKDTAAEAEKEAPLSIKTEAESQKASAAASPFPPPIKTAVDRKGSSGPKGKTPTSATGDGIKKRRKSKAPGTPGLMSPL